MRRNARKLIGALLMITAVSGVFYTVAIHFLAKTSPKQDPLVTEAIDAIQKEITMYQHNAELLKGETQENRKVLIQDQQKRLLWFVRNYADTIPKSSLPDSVRTFLEKTKDEPMAPFAPTPTPTSNQI